MGELHKNPDEDRKTIEGVTKIQPYFKSRPWINLTIVEVNNLLEDKKPLARTRKSGQGFLPENLNEYKNYAALLKTPPLQINIDPTERR